LLPFDGLVGRYPAAEEARGIRADLDEFLAARSLVAAIDIEDREGRHGLAPAGTGLGHQHGPGPRQNPLKERGLAGQQQRLGRRGIGAGEDDSRRRIQSADEQYKTDHR